MPARALLAGVLFFLSGAAALLYQVVWQRILALQSGVGIYSIAIIVAAFMVGLGLGSHAGGVLCERRSARRALVTFALIEIGIAVWGAASGPLLYDLLSLRLSAWFDPLPRAALVQFAFLTPPTFLMGMSLPFLVRALVDETECAARTVGYLYALNTLGAAIGALLTPWVLVRYQGMRAALLYAAAANLLAGLGALALLRGTAEPRREEHASAPAVAGRPLGLWLALYATSGLVALALEVLWFRLIDVAVKSSGFTFRDRARGVPGRLRHRHAPRHAAPPACPPARLPALPGRHPLVYGCRGAGARLDSAARAVLLVVLRPVGRTALVQPGRRLAVGARPAPVPADAGGALRTADGADGPLVRGAAARGARRRARQRTPCRPAAGRQHRGLRGGQPALVGLLSLTLLGSAGTLRALLVLGAALALVAVRLGEGRRVFGALAGALALVAALLPGEQALFRRLHGMTAADTAIVAEDATGVIAVSSHENGLRRVWVNGRHHSVLPFGGIHTLLGAAPAAMHPAPETAAVIGLGSGDTAWAAGCRRLETRSVTVFEICAPQLGLLRRVAAEPDPPAKLGRFLEDPRISIRFADGRNALLRSPERYDLIEMDALFPSSPYAGNLYSVEFYELCARRLRPGGLMCTWAPSPRVHASFTTAFPHVVELDAGRVLVGSNEPIAFDPAAWHARATTPLMVAYLGPARVQALVDFLRGARPAVRRPLGPRDLNRDLFPRDELNSP